jgi:uncharacterized protein (DUF2147 family)
MTLKTTALALVFMPLAASFAQAADPVGTWLVAGQDAIVRIADCASLQASADKSAPPIRTLCGTVVWLKEPIDPATGKPPVDSKNVDPAKNGQPVLGMQGVFDMHPAREPDQWDGRVYSIDDGKIYDGNIIMHSDNELYIQGCYMLFCRGEKWVRQNVPASPKPAAQPAKQPQPRAR